MALPFLGLCRSARWKSSKPSGKQCLSSNKGAAFRVNAGTLLKKSHFRLLQRLRRSVPPFCTSVPAQNGSAQVQAVGWCRVPSGDFCASLALRVALFARNRLPLFRGVSPFVGRGREKDRSRLCPEALCARIGQKSLAHGPRVARTAAAAYPAQPNQPQTTLERSHQ